MERGRSRDGQGGEERNGERRRERERGREERKEESRAVLFSFPRFQNVGMFVT